MVFDKFETIFSNTLKMVFDKLDTIFSKTVKMVFEKFETIFQLLFQETGEKKSIPKKREQASSRLKSICCVIL